MRYPVRLIGLILVLSMAGALSGCFQRQAPESATLPTTSQSSRPATSAPTPTNSEVLPSPYLVWREAQQALDSATSLHLVWRSSDSSGTTSFDVAGTRDASNERQAMTGAGLSSEILVVNGRLYLKGDPAYLRTVGLSEANITKLGSRYMSIDVTKVVEGTGTSPKDLSFVSWVAEVDPLKITLASANLTIEKTEISGAPVYVITEAGSEERTVWVTADASQRPIKISSSTATSSFEMTISEWNAVAPFVAPPASSVLKV